MNCIYRIVWNAAIGKWVVASELASGRRRARTGTGLAVAVAVLGLALISPVALASEINQVLCTAASAGDTSVPCDGGEAPAAAISGRNPRLATDDRLIVVAPGAPDAAASTNGVNMIAIGSNAIARPASNGANAAAIALGANANAAGSFAVAIGSGAAADSQNGSGASGATSVGAGARTTWNGTALGYQANGRGTVVTAVGNAATATGERGIALGSSATATGQYSAAIGAGARATHLSSVAIGEGAQSRANTTFSVGSTTRLRQIENVAAGTQDNDAVSVQQLRDAVALLGGGAGVDDQGAVSAPAYTLTNGGTQSTVAGALGALEGGLSTLDVSVNALDARIRNGSIGLVRQAAPAADLGVAALHDGTAVQFSGTDGARRLRGVAGGTGINDAVTLLQLQDSARSAAAALGGGAALVTDGQWRAPVYSVSATQHRDVGSALTDLDTRTAAQQTALSQLQDSGMPMQRYFQANGSGSDAAQASGLHSIAVGSAARASARDSLALGASAAASGVGGLAVGDGTSSSGSNAVALGNGAIATRDNVLSVGGDTAGVMTRQIIHVANGTARTDAINVAQLRAVVAALGGGAHVDADTGAVSGPQYAVQGDAYTDVGTALGAVDGNVLVLDARSTVNEGNLLDVQRELAAWNSGQAGLVQQVDGAAVVNVGTATGGGRVDFSGTAGARQLSGLAHGQADNDAVNLEQMTVTLAAAQPQDSRYATVNGAGDGSDDARAGAGGAIALGAAAAATATASTALGNAAQALSDGSMALGAGAIADRANTVSVGAAGAERQVTHVADATADTDAVNLRQLKAAGLVGAGGELREAVGYAAGSQQGRVMFSGATGTVLGNVADGQIAAGGRQAVNGGQVAALRGQLEGQLQDLDGRVERMAGQGGGAGGDVPYYGATGTTALVANGAAAKATGHGAVAAGDGAQASADNAVALGAGSVADRADTVSVGQAGAERQVSHVAAGLYETDAVNVSQLREQMASVNSYTDQRVEAMWDTLSDDIGHMRRQVNRGIAASAALVQVTPNLPGKVTLNAGVATYRGESAFGIGLSRWSRNGRYNVNAGVSAARGDQPMINVGFGVAFD